MYVVIWFVVILIIVVRYVNVAKGNGKRGGATRPPQANRPGKWSGQQGGAYSQPARPAQPKSGGYSQRSRPAQSKSGGYGQPARPGDRRYAMPQRPVQSAAYPAKKKSPGENTILQRARANASEQFDEDTLEARGEAELSRVPQGSEIMRDKAFENHIHSGHGENHEAELRNQPGVDDFDTYHLLDDVNDLIVKGYSGNLEFERDFLAEGIDLLNRVSM